MDYTNLKIPNHVALIVDGNGRWALRKGKSRSAGHEAGFINLQKLTSYIFFSLYESCICSPYLSIYYFYKYCKLYCDSLFRNFCYTYNKV